MADTLVTPLNDSFLDFDVLATLDPTNFSVTGGVTTRKWCAKHAGSGAWSMAG